MNTSARICLSLLPFILWASQVSAEISQIDRRVEEVKRAELARSAEQPLLIKKMKPSKAATSEETLEPNAPPPLPLKEIYFSQLSQKHVVFRYDIAKAITILKGVDQKYIDLVSQAAFLQELKILPKRYDPSFDPMQPLRKGLMAYMFYRLLGIRGGVALHLLGPSERYAMKELSYQGFMSSGHVDDLVSGEEFVQVMNRVTEHTMRQSERPK